jgi:hypothetical protein
MHKRMGTCIAGLALVATICAGCGGGGNGKLNAADFANKTCSDLETWGKALTDTLGDLKNISSTSDPQTALKKLGSALGDLDTATATLASNIDKRSAPNVASGDQLKQKLVKAFTDFRTAARAARTKVDNFDLANASSSDLDSFSSDLDSFGSQTDKAFNGLSALSDNSDLDSAFSDSKICDDAQSVFSALSS